MANEVRIKTSVDDKVTGPMSQLQARFEKFGKTAAGAVGGNSQMAKGIGLAAGLAAFNLVGAGISAVTGFLGDSVKAFNEDQASIAQLTTSLKANVPAWDGNTKAIEDVLKARMALGFSDDEQRQSLARLVAATHDSNKALEIERTAMDLARFKGISLADATDALTKVEAGSYRILKSLGIELAKGATQTDALAAVQRVAAGQAADYAQTNEGKLLVSQVKVHEAEEKFGAGLAKLESQILPVVADGITALAGAFEGMGVGVDQSREKLEKWAAQGSLPAQARLAGMNEALLHSRETWDGATGDMVTATEHMRGDIASNFQAIAADVTTDVHIAAKAVEVLPAKMAGDLKGGWDAVHSAAVALGDAMKNPIKTAAREKELQAILDGKGSVGRKLAAGLKSADPLVRQAATQLRTTIFAELDALRGFVITLSANTTYGGRGAGQGGGQTRHPPTPPSPGRAHRPPAAGTGGHTININTLFPPSPQQAAQILRFIKDGLATDRELASYSPG